MDIPLDDPAANKAAAKIQAGFRGHMTRKKMKDEKPREEVSRSDGTRRASSKIKHCRTVVYKTGRENCWNEHAYL